MRRIALHLLAALSLLAVAPLPSAHAQAYKVTNLVSDGSVPAITQDPSFLNPWGISVSGTWWISTADTGLNFVVPSATDTVAFKVIVPSASGASTGGLPAGSVTTSGASGMILSNGAKASFLFSTLDGTISGWNGKLGIVNAVSLIAINNSAAGASYPGLALLNVNSTTSYILAPNFGKTPGIEVYDSTFKPAKLAGSFTDPNLPTGYAPFSIHILNGQVWVAYALQTASAPFLTVNGAGNGLVDVFDNAGNFLTRAVTGGNLDAPWGVAFAPKNFGIFSGDLLIGNFGDGMINVYDPKTFAFLGQLMDSTGKPLTYLSLWDLLPGGTPVGNSTAVSGGDTSTVYFTAGLAGEQHGLLGAISNATVSGAAPTFGFSASESEATLASGGSTQATLSVAPVNGFSGTVTLSCSSGLPAGASCSFSPSSLNVAANAPAISQLTITTTKSAMSVAPALHRRNTAVFSLAVLLPFSALFLVRRRRSLLGRGLLGPLAAVILSLGVAVTIAGCGDSSSSRATPSGQSTVTVTAAGGGTSQQTTIAMVVK